MLTQEQLKSFISYNPDSGEFIWIAPTSKRQRKGSIGAPAGCISELGYLVIGISGKVYKAQRLAWLYVYGKFPEADVDHINGNRADNRIENLRDVSRRANMQNRKKPSKNNKSGYLGVSWFNRKLIWLAAIKSPTKQIRLGWFPTPELASAAYLEAKKKYHPMVTA